MPDFGKQHLGVDLYKTTTAPVFPLNTTVEGAAGSAWVYGQADGAITAAGYTVLFDEAGQAKMATTTGAARGDRVAVPPVAFADNEYGWFQVYGPVAAVKVNTACAANVQLAVTATAGQIDDAVGKTIDGFVLTAAESAGFAPAILNNPVIGATTV